MQENNLCMTARQKDAPAKMRNLAAQITASLMPLMLASAGICACADKVQAQKPIPQLVHTGDQFQLIVDGTPFLILGGQAHNSSASSMEDAENAYKALNTVHANTAEMPVSWNLIEPAPGHFDFKLVDGLIERARTHNLRLVFLWFGTAKNATFSYVPDWVKQDRSKYFRARDARGEEMNAISPFCTAARDADSRAFGALMKHIREFDERTRTVLLMQVENETGLIRTDRDYSPTANHEFAERVPSNFLRALRDHKDALRPVLRTAMQQNGPRAGGTWTEVFGDLAPEAFSAWAISSYVDSVAAAGKAEYPLPYYINVALMNTGSSRPGEWPSGGGTANVIDIWKVNAPHIDIVAPDIYRVDFPEMVDIYDRADNPLFVPETGFAPYYAPYVFTTLAGHNGLGFSPFGIDGAQRAQVNDGYGDAIAAGSRETSASSPLASIEENYRILRPLLPLIASKRYQNSLFPIILNFYRHEAVAIPLGDSLAGVVHFDEIFAASTQVHRAGGIIIKLAPDRFIVAGHGFHLDFEELKGAPRNAEFLTIEEGTFESGRWVRSRVLNGDEENVRLPKGQPRILMVHLNREAQGNAPRP